MVSLRIYKTKDDLVMVLFDKKSKLIMKTPKEKAIELVEKYAYHLWIDGVCDYDNAKQCALIAVDEMIEESIGYLSVDRNKYWKEVKQEIEKL